MPIANPMVQGGGSAGGPPPPAAAPAETPAYAPPAPSTSRFSAIGMGGFGDPDNTSVHCGILIAAALVVVVALKWSGFRFAVDAGVTKG